jgi:hypothetical protein
MLGDLIYEAKGKIVGQRILAVAPQTKIENTILLDGIMRGIVNIIDTGTFVSTAIDDTVYYSQGQGVITTKDRREVATWTAQGIKQYSIRDENDNNSLFSGSAFYYTASKGKLAFLNNIMTVFKSEVDSTGNILNKEWEWK